MDVAEKVIRDFFIQYKERYSDLKEYFEKNNIFIDETKKIGFGIGEFSGQFSEEFLGQLEREVSIDPEMLGKIFEDLLEIKDRKSKGAFYTREEIVHYMCRESLINYLVGEVDVPYDDIKKFILYGKVTKKQAGKGGVKDTESLEENRSISQSIYHNIEKIDDALKNVRVAEPSVGTGAFCLGMLSEIVKARNNITEYIIRKGGEGAFGHRYGEISIRERRSPYRMKLETIKNCIFAMDIEPDAVEVARLRLWLSAVAEREDGNKNPELCSLQNLDMNIRVGNSLIDKWELKFAEVFEEKGGFDIVIGNPPYVGEKGNKEIFRPIAETAFGKKYYRGKMDLFYFFFHKGIDICRDGGIIGFITTNYYITANGAATLRKDLKDRTDILKLVNFNEFKIFKSALGQHNLITFLRKNNGERRSDTEIINVRKLGCATQRDLEKIFGGRCDETDYFSQDCDKLFDGDKTYIRITEDTDRKLESILNKISEGIEIEKICHVNQGIVSGADKLTTRHINKFIIEGQKDEGIFVLTGDEVKDKMFGPEEMELLKPFFKNSDISRYKSNIKTDRSIIYIDRNLRKIDDKYPNIEKHLSKYYPILSQRRETRSGSIEYFHLNWGRNERIFKGEKIITPQRNKSNVFAYNNVPWYSSADVYYITSKNRDIELKYLLGILNSKLYYIRFYHRGKRKGEMLELYQTPLKETPVILSEGRTNAMIKLVDAMLEEIDESKIRLLQSDIDRLVYRIYGLNDSEVRWIEKFLSERKPAGYVVEKL